MNLNHHSHDIRKTIEIPEYDEVYIYSGQGWYMLIEDFFVHGGPALSEEKIEAEARFNETPIIRNVWKNIKHDHQDMLS